jgi:hypothetical protein
VEVPAGGQPRLLQHRHQALPGGARVGGGLEHHELALLEHARERGAGRDQGLKVGLPVLRERSRNGHDHSVHLGEVGVARGGLEAVAHGGQRRVGHVLHVRGPAREGVHYPRVHVHAGDLLTGLAERDGQREADVPQADDPDSHTGAV